MQETGKQVLGMQNQIRKQVDKVMKDTDEIIAVLKGTLYYLYQEDDRKL
jgi:hypothetical protein